MTRVNLDKLEADLVKLAEELIALGTPFAVRRKIKTAIAVLPVIREARK